MSLGSVLTQFGSIVGALGIGSVLGQYVGGSKDRRETRAAVLRELAAVESARWAGPVRKGAASFQDAARDLRTATLVARLPRRPVEEYLALATAARWLSQEDFEIRDPDDEYAGGIDGHLGEAVSASAKGIADLAWVGRWRWRQTWRTAVNAAATAETQIQSPAVHRQVQAARVAAGLLSDPSSR